MASFPRRVLRGLASLFPAQAGEAQLPSSLNASAGIQAVVDTGPIGSWGFSPSTSPGDGGFFTMAASVAPTTASVSKSVQFDPYDGLLPSELASDAAIWIYGVWAELLGPASVMEGIGSFISAPGGSQFRVIDPGQGVPRMPIYLARPADAVVIARDVAGVNVTKWAPSPIPNRLPAFVARSTTGGNLWVDVAPSSTWVDEAVGIGFLCRLHPQGVRP